MLAWESNPLLYLNTNWKSKNNLHKSTQAQRFSEDVICHESWVKYATNIEVGVSVPLPIFRLGDQWFFKLLCTEALNEETAGTDEVFLR